MSQVSDRPPQTAPSLSADDLFGPLVLQLARSRFAAQGAGVTTWDTVGEAERKGRYAAIEHLEEVSPYAPGSPEGQAWIKGYRDLLELVAKHEKGKEKGAADAKEESEKPDDVWDEKPVESVEALNGVNHE